MTKESYIKKEIEAEKVYKEDIRIHMITLMNNCDENIKELENLSDKEYEKILKNEKEFFK